MPRRNNHNKNEVQIVQAKPLTIEPENVKVGKGGNILIGTLNVFINPVKNRWDRFYHPNKNKFWHAHLFVDALLSLIIISLIVLNILWLLNGGTFIVNNKIDLKLTTDSTEVMAGQDISINVSYHNGSTIKLTDGKITISVPENFILTDATPNTLYNAATHTFTIGDIDSGANGTLTLHGAAFGSLNEKQKIQATLNYAGSGNLRKQKIVSLPFTIHSSLIDTKIELPEKVFVHQPITGTITVTNNSAHDIAQCVVDTDIVKYDFTLLSSSMPYKDGWRISNCKAHTSYPITFSGFFTKKTTLSSLIQLYAIFGTTPKLQNETEKSITVTQSNLHITIASTQKTITPGDSAIYTLTYKNEEKINLKDVVITAHITNRFVTTQTLSWDKKSTPALATIAPGKEGTIEFTVPTNSINPTSINDKDFTALIRADASYQLPAAENVIGFSSSNELQQKIETVFIAKAYGRYYTDEGDAIGMGPLPPVANQPTRYWIILTAATKYNDMNNVIFTGQLPDNVTWTNKISTTAENPVSYDATTRRIAWRVNTIKAPSSLYADTLVAFEVEIVPTTDQVGKTAELVSHINVVGTDGFTGKQYQKAHPAITTKLISDSLETSSGIINN